MSTTHLCEHEDCPKTWCYRDPENWDWENAEQLQEKPSGAAVFQIRLSRDELRLASQAAEFHGEAIIQRARRLLLEDAALPQTRMTVSAAP